MSDNLKVAIIGAGMAGILAAIKLKEFGIKNITIFEKGDGVGGTWRDNSYPGLHCDVPSHHYTYSFERNPNWSNYYSSGPEIRKYFEGIFFKNDLDQICLFKTEIISLSFKESVWEITTNKSQTYKANIVIGATGVLHHPYLPDIEGINNFNGDKFHSARWDHGLSLKDKKIGVIGSGSTGIQIVSALSGKCNHLYHFQRTAQWMMPLENGSFSDEEKLSFQDPKNLSEAMNFEEYFNAVEIYSQALLDKDSIGANEIAFACKENLEKNIHNEELKKRLTPDHTPLCKRLIWSSDYYPAIQKPECTLITEPIKKIINQGIELSDNSVINLDVIVFATGFKVDQFLRPIKTFGIDGIYLDDYWKEYPKAYLSIAVPKFPNLFLLNGPNGPVGNFSLIDIAEQQMNYILELIKIIRKRQCHIDVKTDITEAYERDRAVAAKKTVWYTGGCTSWYLNAAGIPASWPWTYKDFKKEMSKPNLDAFELNE